VLRELVNVIESPVSVTFEKSWRLGDVPEDCEKVKVTSTDKKGLKEDPRNYRPISLTSVPGKAMEQIFLGTFTSEMKHMFGKSQHRFTKGKLCLTNMITFHDKITCSVDVGQEVNVVCLHFFVAFSTVSHSSS